GYSEEQNFQTLACKTPTPPSPSGGSRSGSVSAPTTPTQVIAGLQVQLQALITQLIAMGGTVPTDIPTNLSITENLPVRDLTIGMSGEDVRALQNLLISQGYSIPAGSTGFFANQTRSALSMYQSANNISPAIGYFGPITRTFMKATGLLGLW